jgi:hypothetical protein
MSTSNENEKLKDALRKSQYYWKIDDIKNLEKSLYAAGDFITNEHLCDSCVKYNTSCPIEPRNPVLECGQFIPKTLLSCPFCNNKANIFNGDDPSVECQSCNCHISGKNILDAIKQWNTRIKG